jgi:hypothetical protein
MKELPKEIFVTLEEDGDDNWLSASESPSGHADISKDVIAGRYKLQETVRIGLVTQVDPVK